MIREYLDYVEDMLHEIESIEFFNKDIDFSNFLNDKKTYYATIRALEIIGEASKKIPDFIRIKYPQIPWIDISAMRNKLTHEYFGVNLEVVWFTIKNDLISLKPILQEILKSQENATKSNDC